MNIPQSFKMGGLQYTVVIEDTIENGNRFGEFREVSQQIALAKRVKEGDNLVECSEDMIFSTFLHELVHCLQANYDGEFAESEAQSYANLLFEFLRTKQ